MMAEAVAQRTPRHATTLSTLNVAHENNRLNRVHVRDYPLRKQRAVISLSASRDREPDVEDGGQDGGHVAARRARAPRKLRKISTLSVPEGKDRNDALVLLHNGNHGFLAEDEEDDDEDADEDEEDGNTDEEEVEVEVEVAGAVGRRHRVPDGGWGWAVVAAAFFINMASDGISFSFGLLYIEFLRYFGESRSTTSWIGSLFMAVPMLTGPVASAMVDRYGCRAMTIVGGVVSALGFTVAASASTIGQMYLTFGLLAGLGLGLCFITAVVSIAYWFERKRTLAMSLGAAGTGFGTFIYAPMTNYFISEYGWRGTVLLLAGTFLNLCVCGVVMRDPGWWRAEQAAQAAHAAQASHREQGLQQDADELLPLKALPLAVPLSRVARSLPYTQSAQGSARPVALATRSEDNLASLAAFLPPSRQPASTHSAPPTPSTPVSPGPLSSAPPSAPPTLLTFNTIPELEVLEDLAAEDGYAAAEGSSQLHATPSEPVVVPPHPHRQPRTTARRPSGELEQPLRRQPAARRQPALLQEEGQPQHHPGQPAVRGIQCFTRCSPRWYSNTVELVRAMLDFSLFLELHFLLMSVGTTLLYTWFVVPYFYLADHLTRNGYTEAEASRLLGVVGVANTVGMVALGWVGDHPRLNVTKTYALCLAVCGTATAAMLVFTDRYWLLLAACAAFGVTFASTFSFTPTILVTLVPMERFTIAYGLNLLCQGIGNLLGPPFAGWLFDLTHSWDWSFYMAGLWIVVAGFLTGLISYTNNKRFFGSLGRGLDGDAPGTAVSSPPSLVNVPSGVP